MRSCKQSGAHDQFACRRFKDAAAFRNFRRINTICFLKRTDQL
nr:MAG TPA: hypothetical protein [Caudoviricetes sp.]